MAPSSRGQHIQQKLAHHPRRRPPLYESSKTRFRQQLAMRHCSWSSTLPQHLRAGAATAVSLHPRTSQHGPPPRDPSFMTPRSGRMYPRFRAGFALLVLLREPLALPGFAIAQQHSSGRRLCKAWRGDLRMSRIEVVFARWADSEAALYLGLVPDDSRGTERVIWLQGIGDAVLVWFFVEKRGPCEMERTGELVTGSFGGIKAGEKSDNGLQSWNWNSDRSFLSVMVFVEIALRKQR
ncbi:hypothetical protein X797_008507 [Metarhizium robertsii]|uniref:Uncharacterized protein n=1 Tax=Metarhizium robertsii TaxID=568076 RepID=A0A0A1URQ5_9HYPO|nr:hypothetical protein X797_008507 [Metarhizium robertsii]